MISIDLRRSIEIMKICVLSSFGNLPEIWWDSRRCLRGYPGRVRL
jgi:hypothetical protein